MAIQALQASPSFGQDDQTVQKKSLAPYVAAGVVTTAAGAGIPQAFKPSEDKFEKSTDVAKKVYEENLKKANDEIEAALKGNADEIKNVKAEDIEAKRKEITEQLKKDHDVMQFEKDGKVRVKTEQEFNDLKKPGQIFEKETRSYEEMKAAFESYDAKIAEVKSLEEKLAAKSTLETAEKAAERAEADAKRLVKETVEGKEVVKIDGKTAEEFNKAIPADAKDDAKRTFEEIKASAEKAEASRTELNNLRKSGLAAEKLEEVNKLEEKATKFKANVEALTSKEGGKPVTMLDDLKQVFKDMKAGKTIAEDKKQEKEIVEGIMKKIKNKNSMIYGIVGLAVGAAIVAYGAVHNKNQNA